MFLALEKASGEHEGRPNLPFFVGMAELVDALGLGSSVLVTWRFKSSCRHCYLLWKDKPECRSKFREVILRFYQELSFSIRAISAAVAQLLYTQLVGGSNPSSPIKFKKLNERKCYQ